jgi:hypothetical protein
VDEAKPISKHVRKRKRRTVIGPHAAAIQLLLFTGSRLREVLHLKPSRRYHREGAITRLQPLQRRHALRSVAGTIVLRLDN